MHRGDAAWVECPLTRRPEGGAPDVAALLPAFILQGCRATLLRWKQGPYQGGG